MAVDPVCKTIVDEIDTDSTEHEDDVYFFCSEICKQVFQDDPVAFTAGEYDNRPFTYS
jgi:YHS domain-containing protein